MTISEFVTEKGGFVNPEKITAIDLYGFEKAKKSQKENERKVEEMKNECSTLLDKLYLSGLKPKQIAVVEKLQDVLGV